MFGWRKQSDSGREPQGPSPQAEGDPIIAALLVAGYDFDLAPLERKLRASKPGGGSPSDFKTERGFLTFDLGDELVAVAVMPAPYPWSDLEGPCATSWMWPKRTPASSVRAHQCHVLITAMRGRSAPIVRRLGVTQIVGLAAELPGVLGVYWPEGTLVHYPPVFTQMARKITSVKGPPLYLWVDFRVFRNQDGSFGLFTTGLRWLGHLELEIPRLAMPPGELRDWAVNIAYYLLENGSKIKDGHTIGMSATQQLRIRFVPSRFGGERGTVMRIES
jgi:hypothetical protein